MRTLHADDRLFNALGLEMARVDELRVKLKRADLFPEFLMRRAILRARFAILQRNQNEARHMLKTLAQFANDQSP